MLTYVGDWVRVEIFEPHEPVEGFASLAPWVDGWPRRRRARLRLHRQPATSVVADWPVGALVDDRTATEPDLVGVGLFRPARLVCRVCRRDLVVLRAEATGCGVFDRWRDGAHHVLRACPACGAGRRDAGLVGALAITPP